MTACRRIRERLAPFRRGPGRGRGRSRHRRGLVLRHARPLGVGQDDLPAADLGLRAADGRDIRIFGRTCGTCRPTGATSTPCSRTTRCSRIMNVRDNVAYGLMVAASTAATRQAAAEELLALVKLPGYGDRKPGAALGRAAAAGGARPRAGQPSRACCCSTSRSARSTSSCARRCRTN
jgi:hypothetical protein